MILFSCSIKNNWHDSYIIYRNGFSQKAQTLAKKGSYYTFIKSRSDSTSHEYEILIPEDVISVSTDDVNYVSIYFDEENYGMESWSFGKVLSGNQIQLIETKFQYKTCACATAGKFFHGYFLVYKNEHLKIKLDNSDIIYNLNEIYSFMEKHNGFELSQGINTLQDLIDALENINN